jgi:beta-lactamase class A
MLPRRSHAAFAGFLLPLCSALNSCCGPAAGEHPGPARSPRLSTLPAAVQTQIQSELQRRLDAACAEFGGRVGFYVQHLETGIEASRRPDELFPTASMIKVPILVTLFDAIEKGRVDYGAKLSYDRSRLYPGDDLLGKFRDGESIGIPKLIHLMESLSDNTASLWLQELCGTGTAINAWLAAHGFERIRMNSRTPGRKPDWERYGWGQCSPREMARLLAMIRRGQAGSPWATERMRRALARSFWDGESLSQIPAHVEVLSKQGAVSDSRSEVLLAHAHSGDYVACFVTDSQEDKSWVADNEGFVLLRKLSAICWELLAASYGPSPEPPALRTR